MHPVRLHINTLAPLRPRSLPPSLPPSLSPQWFKAYWDQVTVGQPIGPYDGPSRRAVCKTGDIKTSGGAAGGAKAVGRSVPTSSAAPVRAAAAAPAVRAAPTNSGSRAIGGGAGDRDQVDKLANQLEVGWGAGATHGLGAPFAAGAWWGRGAVSYASHVHHALGQCHKRGCGHVVHVLVGTGHAGARGSDPDHGMMTPKPHLNMPVPAPFLQDLRLKADGFEKEKDFYYSKLRDVELLCQTPVITELPIMKRVQVGQGLAWVGGRVQGAGVHALPAAMLVLPMDPPGIWDLAPLFIASHSFPQPEILRNAISEDDIPTLLPVPFLHVIILVAPSVSQPAGDPVRRHRRGRQPHHARGAGGVRGAGVHGGGAGGRVKGNSGRTSERESGRPSEGDSGRMREACVRGREARPSGERQGLLDGGWRRSEGDREGRVG